MNHGQIIAAWNSQADEHNRWNELGEDEKIEFAYRLAAQQDAPTDADTRAEFEAAAVAAGKPAALVDWRLPTGRYADDAVEFAWKVWQSARRAPAQNAEQERDAERYRLLRRGQHWSVIDGIGNTLRAESLDDAIDAARAQRAAAQGDSHE